MRWRLPIGTAVVGVALLAVLLPFYDAAQPRGLTVTRRQVAETADREARRLGIEVDRAFRVVAWEGSMILGQELEKHPALRRAAEESPVLAPRVGVFKVIYFRRGLEKYPEYGRVIIGRDGQVLGVHRLLRQEEKGAKPDADSLRRQADAFATSRAFPGAPSPVYEGVTPTVLPSRTDLAFRYRVASPFPKLNLALYLEVYFNGDQPAGWELTEEYPDGRPFRYDTGGRLAGEFFRFVGIFVLVGVLLSIFLRKYHAGELGVGTGFLLLLPVAGLLVVFDALVAPWSSLYVGFGGMDAARTALAQAAFKFLLFDVPVAVLVFLGWSVGESYARERWGHKLASLDALLRRDLRNATVGRSLLVGLLVAPLVAAATLLPPLVPVLLGAARPTMGDPTNIILSAVGGPWAFPVLAACNALTLPVVALLFNLAVFSKHRRLVALGFGAALVSAAVLGGLEPPVAPALYGTLLGFGGVLAAAVVFLAEDLLSSVTTVFGGQLLLGFLPYLRAAHGGPAAQALAALSVPLLVLLGVAILGLLTRREVEYAYEDLAPHVRRIVERERVKAEIDAANRIQAALLPARVPDMAGSSFASHYQAATEIGGDYFDFLPLKDGRLGLAFGDVSGHGLTSGIVMAMAKSALLVQVGYDTSPVRVMEVLNETVMKTAPKRILMTFFFGVLDVEERVLRFSSAGHLDPYVYRARERRLTPLSSWGFPLGVRRREPFRETVTRFEDGDRLILYSDGLIEATNDDGDLFGFERFEAALLASGHLSPAEIKKALLGSVRRFTANRPPEDDQTLVVISFEETVALAAAS